jgi:hypothetical protein
MATLPARAARVKAKPVRTVKLIDIGHPVLMIRQTTGEKTEQFEYSLRRLASDFGTAFELAKWDDAGGVAERYNVLLHGAESTCDCKGFTYRGRCKHLESLTALQAAGKL